MTDDLTPADIRDLLHEAQTVFSALLGPDVFADTQYRLIRRDPATRSIMAERISLMRRAVRMLDAAQSLED